MSKKKKKIDDTTEQGVVLYVDGGCRAGYKTDQLQSRYGGWGFHGYTYPIDKHPPKLRTKKDIPTVTGYKPGEKTTLKDQVIPSSYLDGYGSMSRYDDNIKAEMEGFHQAINFIKDRNFKKIHFVLDNQYVIDGISGGYEKWDKANWNKPTGGKYANEEKWKSIMGVYQPLSENSLCTVSWVNGHSGDLGNDRADYLATKGVYLGRNGELNKIDVKESPISKYRDPKPIINRLFVKNRWYFNTDEEPLKSQDGRYVYHCGAHGPDDSLVGMPASEAVIYIVYTKEVQSVLENVRTHHRRLLPNPYNELCMANLDTLLLPRIYDEIEKDGVGILSIAPRRLGFEGLCTVDERQVTKVIRPSGLTFRLIDQHNALQHILDRHLEGKSVATDITDVIYKETVVEKSKKKTEIQWELLIEPGQASLKTEVKVGMDESIKPCKLTIGIDTPPREVFHAIRDQHPKIEIITWVMSDAAFRYAVVITLEDDVMIWMGKDSSVQLVLPETWLKK